MKVEKRKSDLKTDVLNIRISPAQKEMLRRLARNSQRSLANEVGYLVKREYILRVQAGEDLLT